MRLYSVAYFTQRADGKVRYGSVLIWADSKPEAVGLGLEFILEQRPVDSGWFSHSAVAFEIDRDVIIRAYNSLQD